MWFSSSAMALEYASIASSILFSLKAAFPRAFKSSAVDMVRKEALRNDEFVPLLLFVS